MNKPIDHSAPGAGRHRAAPEGDSLRIRLEKLCGNRLRRRQPVSLILLEIDLLHLPLDGQPHNDTALQHVESLARRLLRGSDVLGCFNDQELICCLPDAGRTVAEELARRLREAIAATPLQLGENEFRLSARVAVACAPEDGNTLDLLLAAGVSALQHARGARVPAVVSAARLRQEFTETGQMLSEALRQNRIRPALQPVFDLQHHRKMADEALARVLSPSGKAIPASAFLETAHQLQLTRRIDQAVLLQTLAWCRHTQPADSVVINISGALLQHAPTVSEVLHAAQALQPGIRERRLSLILAVTERELNESPSFVHRLLQPFLELGMRLALDDFGSGYSSYRWLADLPIEFIKIEGSLIRRLAEPRVRSIVQGIRNTASDLGIVTIAEHIENSESAERARELGIDWGQGYYFGRPQLLDAGQ